MEDKFEILKNEHALISITLTDLSAACQRRDLTPFIEVLKKLENQMRLHYDNEEVVFSKAFGHAKLSEGGPFCSLYFERFMGHRPLPTLVRLIQKIEPAYKEPKPFSYYEKYFSANSPLSIPCEEHMAILVLLQFIIVYMDKPQKISWDWLSEAVKILNQWIQFNHEKEDSCLFQMLQHIFASEK